MEEEVFLNEIPEIDPKLNRIRLEHRLKTMIKMVKEAFHKPKKRPIYPERPLQMLEENICECGDRATIEFRDGVIKIIESENRLRRPDMRHMPYEIYVTAGDVLWWPGDFKRVKLIDFGSYAVACKQVAKELRDKGYLVKLDIHQYQQKYKPSGWRDWAEIRLRVRW